MIKRIILICLFLFSFKVYPQSGTGSYSRPPNKAGFIKTDTTNFNDILTSSENTIQKALDKLDDNAFNVNGDTLLGNIYMNGNRLCWNSSCTTYFVLSGVDIEVVVLGSQEHLFVKSTSNATYQSTNATYQGDNANY